MIRFLADENFDNVILRGIKRRVPEVEILRVQDSKLAGQDDRLVLAWAAEYGYIVLSHDVNTMRGYFYDRMREGLPLPGLFLVHGNKPLHQVIDSLELILLTSELSEWLGDMRYLPL